MTDYIWPVPPSPGGGYVFSDVQDFGPRTYMLNGELVSDTHHGLDFGRAAATPIVAIAAGTVVHKVVDPYKDTNGGNEIRIDHGGGIVSGYSTCRLARIHTFRLARPLRRVDPWGWSVRQEPPQRGTIYTSTFTSTGHGSTRSPTYEARRNRAPLFHASR